MHKVDLMIHLTSLQENIDHLITSFKSIGLRVNVLKTESVKFCPSASKQLNSRPDVTVEQMKIFHEQVKIPGNNLVVMSEVLVY